MKKTAFAALVLALAAPAGAQEYRQQQARAAEDAYQNLQHQAAQFRSSQAASVGPRVLDVTLVAMNDGPEAGGRVMRLLDEKKIDVYLATQTETVKRGVVNGRAAILLSDALPPHPRVYAPLIAAEAAKLMYEDMPDCAERSYMRMATAARVYAELGGEFKTLPVVDGDRVDAVKTAVGLWSDGAEGALDALAQSDHLPTIPDLQQKAADPKTVSALEAANSRFTAFLMDESDARRTALQR
jgi:hypothetical protein